MGKTYNTIAFHPDKCDGCNDCSAACAYIHTETTDRVHSRITVVPDWANNTYGIAQCRHCANPRCVMDCPTKALTKDEETGVVNWDKDKCVNCQLCTLACSWAGITFNPVTRQIMKCNFCEGDPSCVKACKPEALKLITEGHLHDDYGDLEDLFVPGLSSCLGCNSELLIRHTLRRIGPNTVVAIPPGCVGGVGTVGVNGFTGTKVPTFFPLLTNTASMLAGARRYYNRIGRDVTMLAFAGDGGAADVGFQSLSGAAERGEQMIFVCIDNEGYMNTGVQRSSTTPYGSWTSTTPVGTALRGKKTDAKPLPILMIMHHCEYVATANLAFMEDFYTKLDKAIKLSEKGMAYLHVFSPCPTGWRYPPNNLIEVSRKAVETNMSPLWEYTNQESFFRFTHSVDNPRKVGDYLSLVGKYRHLSEEQIAHIQITTDKQIELLKGFTRDENDVNGREARPNVA